MHLLCRRDGKLQKNWLNPSKMRRWILVFEPESIFSKILGKSSISKVNLHRQLSYSILLMLFNFDMLDKVGQRLEKQTKCDKRAYTNIDNPKSDSMPEISFAK